MAGRELEESFIRSVSPVSSAPSVVGMLREPIFVGKPQQAGP
jgi:hypothetical protein